MELKSSSFQEKICGDVLAAGDFPCGLAVRTEKGQPLTNKEITLGVQSSATRPDGLMSAPIYSRFRHDIMGGIGSVG